MEMLLSWPAAVCLQTNIYPLTGSGSGQQGDDEGQAQTGDMSRYHRRPPQPHIQPEVPHPQPLSHRAVLHIRPHGAEPPPAGLPADSGGCTGCAETERRGAGSAGTLHELHDHFVKVEEQSSTDRQSDGLTLVKLHTMTTHVTSGLWLFQTPRPDRASSSFLPFFSGVTTRTPPAGCTDLLDCDTGITSRQK